MSTPSLVNVCTVCGSEESLDGLLLRMIDDDAVRSLIADVLTKSLPLGGLLLRYLRLHKPLKQRLRMATLQKLLAELVPDMQRTAIERKGRIWLVSNDTWRDAFHVVFDAVEKGTLTLPLEGNGYLYGVLARMADRHEAAIEQGQIDASRGRAHEGGTQSMAQLVQAGVAPANVVEQAAPDPAAAARASAIKDQLRAALEQKRARHQEPGAQQP
jgi:hypothetical protein